MTHLMKKAETKAEILSRWTQDNVEVFSQVGAKWEDFNALLSQHKQDINKQVNKFQFIDKFTEYPKQYLVFSYSWTV